MKYTIHNFRADFPTDEACLEYLFRTRFPGAKGYYRVRERQCYSHQSTRHQIHPLAGTIFQKTATPLTSWFYAIYLFSVSKNGVSAKELQRQLGVTYKTAWRMAYQIRHLMEQDTDPLQGTIEADETYLTPGRRIPVVGAVKRGGAVRARHVKNLKEESVEPFLRQNVQQDATLVTDDGRVYQTIDHAYTREVVNKSVVGYTRGNFHVNSIEAFWSHVKRSINGTYHFISEQHAQKYLDEFTFRYNVRNASYSPFSLLLAQACR